MAVSVLFNESKLLKFCRTRYALAPNRRFSTLQRVEIAEIQGARRVVIQRPGFSTLQRVEIAEISHRTFLRILRLWFQYSSTSRNC